jgi:predicted DNA-binding protein (UPF0251 family)
MVRPRKCRWVCGEPNARYFKPRGIPLTVLAQSTLTLDELEALRLADVEGLEQGEAAERMKISRQTFGRILEKARRTVADAIVNSKAIKIEGGDVKMVPKRKFSCSNCGHNWEVPYGTGRPSDCPKCQSKNIHRAEEDRGYAQCGGAKRGPCGKGRSKKSTN